MSYVAETATVSGNAKIGANVMVYDHAVVSEDSIVEGNVTVNDNACVKGKACVHSQGYMGGFVHVYGGSILEGDVNISRGQIRDVHWWRDVP